MTEEGSNGTVYAAARKRETANFTCHEIPPGTVMDMRPLNDKLLSGDDVEPYVAGNGKTYRKPQNAGGGYTTTHILPELHGVPLSNLVLAYVHGFRPTSVRVSYGEVCLDARSGRVTIYVDGHNRVDHIVQEIEVLYGAGADVQSVLTAVKAGRPPAEERVAGGSSMNAKALLRAKFD